MTPADLSSKPQAAARGSLPPALPGTWSVQLGGQLRGGEKILAWLGIDLDARLRFAGGIVVVTSERLLARSADAGGWQGWDYRPGLALTRRDHSGVGTLELLSLIHI